MSWPIRMWTDGVEVESEAYAQLKNTATLPILGGHLAVMPDVHWGMGATVGSVIPTVGAIIPAAVGVDIGCGMCAALTDLTAADLPDSLSKWRHQIERSVPVGFNYHDDSLKATGGLEAQLLNSLVAKLWDRFEKLPMQQDQLLDGLNLARAARQLGTLGGGNHFIEICLDSEERVWVMLHSGSRNIGKTIADVAINLAKGEAQTQQRNLPDSNLAWLVDGTDNFRRYVTALRWAQDYAALNRDLMMHETLKAIAEFVPVDVVGQIINCHHNYASLEEHMGREMWITRKGAVSARAGQYGIIPGSMGTRSYIVQGKGNADSYCSCSHGAGRRMSRGKAKKQFTLDDLAAQTAGVECRKDQGVLDEIPGAYKDIDAVMEAQKDLVSVVATLKQVMCIKG